jgi:hypothetical protein
MLVGRELFLKCPPGLSPRRTGHGPGTRAHGHRPTVRVPLIAAGVFVILATVWNRLTNKRAQGAAARVTRARLPGSARLKAHGPRPGAGSRAQAAQLRELRPTARVTRARSSRPPAHGPRYGQDRPRAHGPRPPCLVAIFQGAHRREGMQGAQGHAWRGRARYDTRPARSLRELTNKHAQGARVSGIKKPGRGRVQGCSCSA